MGLNRRIRDYTEALEKQGLLRARQISDPASPQMIYFDSNDYLSLTQDARVAQAYQDAYAAYPSGSGASMLLSGYHANHQALEQAFAEFLDVDACILFSSGYAANLAITSLMGKIKAHCYLDKSMHASVYDGLHLSQVLYTRFIHNDISDLTHKLDAGIAEALVMTEGIFSMSGQIAPLSLMSKACVKKNAPILVDEAHSFGVLGRQGRGTVDYHGLTQNEVPLRVIPLGKACAAQGAVLAGKKEWIQAVLQAGRSLVYSTAVSPALAYGLLKTLDLVVAADDRRLKINQLIGYFKESIKESPLAWIDSDSPIQQLLLGCPHLALHYAQELKKAGINCSAIRSPTVRVKDSGLRIILNYRHEEEQITQLFYQLKRIYEHTP